MSYFSFLYKDVMDVASVGVHRFSFSDGFCIYINGVLVFELNLSEVK